MNPTKNTQNSCKRVKEHLEDISQECFITLFTIKQEQEKAWREEEERERNECFVPKVREDKYIFSDLMRQTNFRPKEEDKEDLLTGVMAIDKGKRDPKCEPKKEPKPEPKKEVKKSPCDGKGGKCGPPPVNQTFTNQCAEIAALPEPKEYEVTKGDFDGNNKGGELICKVKRSGACGERLICEEIPQAKQPSQANLKPGGDVIRILRCRVLKDDCDKQALTCQELPQPPPKEDAPPHQKCPDAKEELKHIFKQSKQQGQCPKPKKKKLTIGQKLVCKAEMLDAKSGQKNVTCNVMEVKEEKAPEDCTRKPLKRVIKQSPYTYKELVELSARIRKENEVKLAKERADKLAREKEEKKKKKDEAKCKTKAKK